MNGWQLSFTERFDYSRFNDIVLPLNLAADEDNQILLRAKVDTGSTFCVFQRRHADLLNIDLETETQRRIRTATGSFTAYGHEVTIRIGQLEWHMCRAGKQSGDVTHERELALTVLDHLPYELRTSL